MFLIDYGHLRDGVLYHGTVSDLDGVVKATWTYELDGEKVTRDQPIDLARFASLWGGIANLEVFQRNVIRSPDVPIDPTTHHVVGIVFKHEGQQGHYVYLIPAGEADPQFRAWLEALDVPTGSA